MRDSSTSAALEADALREALRNLLDAGHRYVLRIDRDAPPTLRQPIDALKAEMLAASAVLESREHA
jgi:hypothetical protein